MNQPPLGLVPKEIWDESRASEIVRACERYFEASKPIPIALIEEYNLLAELFLDAREAESEEMGG